MPVSEAACPAGISSFFEICKTDSSGAPLADPVQIGTRGGGFAIERGVSAKVTVKKSQKSKITIRINSSLAPEAHTTRSAVNEILGRNDVPLDVLVDLKLRVPMKAGFGTSAAGTLAACLALSDAADFPSTMNALGRIVHVAEVVNGTGLGTASALVNGGFVLVREPGAPGVGLVDRLQFPLGHFVICGYIGQIATAQILAQSNLTIRVNPAAQRAMQAILAKPDLPTFLTQARLFCEAAGFQTPNVTRLIEGMVEAGASGATQNMLGEAVHGVVSEKKAKRVLRNLRKRFPRVKFFLSRLDTRGARLLERTNPKH